MNLFCTDRKHEVNQRLKYPMNRNVDILKETIKTWKWLISYLDGCDKMANKNGCDRNKVPPKKIITITA